MQLIDESLISTDPLPWPNDKGISITTLRLDKVHPAISGNKWYKLRYYIESAIAAGHKEVVTFGGAYSNHIVAAAAAASRAGLRATGVIRGGKPLQPAPTLLQAAALGMWLVYVSRADYKNKILPPTLASCGAFVIPEGGYGPAGAAGAATIPIPPQTDYICCAVGTGTTMAGLINANPQSTVTGISILKNYTGHTAEVKKLLTRDSEPVTIVDGYHFGGYGKKNKTLIDFMNGLWAETRIPTDFVYTGKLFYAVRELLAKGYFKSNSNVLVIHSGGLQGNRSLPAGTLMF